MKISATTVRGTNFEIEANRDDAVLDVKKIIEKVQGADVYPATQQLLIHQGKVLNDTTTLGENNVADNSCLFVMLNENKPAAAGASSASPAPASQGISEQADTPPVVRTTATPPTDIPGQAGTPLTEAPQATDAPANFDIGIPPAKKIKYQLTAAPSTGGEAGNPLTEAPQATGAPASGPTTGVAGGPAGGPNEFQKLSTLVQGFFQLLKDHPMFQELGKLCPKLMCVIQDHQSKFLRVINEAVEGGKEMVPMTPEDVEAMKRLQAMGNFKKGIVREVYYACVKDEKMAARYLLNHADEFSK